MDMVQVTPLIISLIWMRYLSSARECRH